jgi:hypothetical protein
MKAQDTEALGDPPSSGIRTERDRPNRVSLHQVAQRFRGSFTSECNVVPLSNLFLIWGIFDSLFFLAWIPSDRELIQLVISSSEGINVDAWRPDGARPNDLGFIGRYFAGVFS